MNRTLHLALMACLLLPGAASAQARPGVSEKDREQLLRIKAAFEAAVNRNKPDLVTPYMDPKFSGDMLSQRIDGPEGFRNACQKAAADIGHGKMVDGYNFRLMPDMDSLKIEGDRAAASGTTEESVHTPTGWVQFRTVWTANMVKKDGQWMLAQMISHFDPASTVSANLNAVVRNLWAPLSKLSARGPSVDRPDYDGDNLAYLNAAP